MYYNIIITIVRKSFAINAFRESNVKIDYCEFQSIDPLTHTFSGDGHPILFCGFLLPYFCESHMLRSPTALFIWIAPTDLLKVRRPIGTGFVQNGDDFGRVTENGHDTKAEDQGVGQSNN
uniref:Uncharacterized protein n=1 Tax=Glossina pallidipes TaxID=7398 RepID=A0A1A9Z221_GLOPL